MTVLNQIRVNWGVDCIQSLQMQPLKCNQGQYQNANIHHIGRYKIYWYLQLVDHQGRVSPNHSHM